jgi:hypothetical protein
MNSETDTMYNGNLDEGYITDSQNSEGTQTDLDEMLEALK